MEEEEYQAGLDALRRDWGSVSVDPRRPGVLIAANDPTTGLTAGYRAPIFAEIINRALKAEQSNRVEELVPCPHCADRAVELSDGGRGLRFYVICTACEARGPVERCAIDARDAWNRRTATSPDGVEERVARAINEARRVRTNPDRPDSDEEYALKLARAAIAAISAEGDE